MDNKPKRQTYTSSAVKWKYNNAHYQRITVNVPIDTAAEYRVACEKLGLTLSDALHEAISTTIAKAKEL